MNCKTEKAGKDLLLKLVKAPAFPAKKIVQNLVYEAVTPGASGNDITVEIVDTATGGLSVSVAASAIEVDLGGDTPNATDIKAAIEASAPVSALVKARCYGDVEAAQVIQAATNLEDGLDEFSTPTTIGGLRSKGMTINNEAIDVTSHDSEQYKTLLDGAGIRSFTVSGAGIFTTSQTLDYARRAAHEGRLVELTVIDDAAQKQFRGFYKLTSMERTGEYNAEQPWSLSIESSGEVVFESVTA